MSRRTGSWRAGKGMRVEHNPEFDGVAAPQTAGGLTNGEAALFAGARSGGLRFAARRERWALARARARLVRAALGATGWEQPPGSPQPVAGPGDERGERAAEYAAGLTLPPWLVGAVVVVVTVVEFLFWLTLGRQSVRFDDYTSPAALQAVALALLFPAVVFAGARIGAALGHLPALPPGVSRAWYRNRALAGVTVVVTMSVAMALTAHVRFRAEGTVVGAVPLPVLPLVLAFFVVPLLTLAVHAFAAHPEAERRVRIACGAAARERTSRSRAAAECRATQEWHLAAVALDAEIRRVVDRYALEVAAGEARVLRHRARYGVAPAPLVVPGGDPDAPPSWLGIPVLPVRRAVQVSERVLREYGPPPMAGHGPDGVALVALTGSGP